MEPVELGVLSLFRQGTLKTPQLRHLRGTTVVRYLVRDRVRVLESLSCPW